MSTSGLLQMQPSGTSIIAYRLVILLGLDSLKISNAMVSAVSMLMAMNHEVDVAWILG